MKGRVRRRKFALSFIRELHFSTVCQLHYNEGIQEIIVRQNACLFVQKQRKPEETERGNFGRKNSVLPTFPNYFRKFQFLRKDKWSYVYPHLDSSKTEFIWKIIDVQLATLQKTEKRETEKLEWDVASIVVWRKISR